MKHFKLKVAAMALALAPVAAMSAPTVDELWDTIKKQQAEINKLKKGQEITEQKVEATADAVEANSGGVSKSVEWASKTKIGGYGEHHYNNFQGSDDQVDAHRYVLYASHEYSDTVRFFSEFEIEHSLAGDGKPGEVELEQAYIEWDYTRGQSLVAGQFLIPVGIINETHEPDTFYGVERNLVEKNIIPTTWWETGLLFRGEISPGLSYDLAIHSGLKTSDGGKIRSGRQKSAEAVANDFAYTGRLKYTGVAGLELAATVQVQEDITQGDVAAGENASATLFETHAIYSTGGFSIRALYADWDVDGDAFEANGRDSQNGWYIEPSFKVSDKLGFFVRASEWNNNAGDPTIEDGKAKDIGVNFWLTPNVVFKADYQDAEDFADSFNLGVGWSY